MAFAALWACLVVSLLSSALTTGPAHVGLAGDHVNWTSFRHANWTSNWTSNGHANWTSSGDANWTCNGRHPSGTKWDQAGISECAVGQLADAVLTAREGADFTVFQKMAANSINEFLAPLVVHLPDPGLQNNNGVTYEITEVVCRHLSVGHLRASAARLTELRVALDSTIDELSFECTANWRYEFAYVFRGNGWISLSSQQSSVRWITDLDSQVPGGPPLAAVLPSCDTSVVFSEATLHGGVVASIVNLFEGMLKDNIASGVQDSICEQLTEMTKTTLTEQLASAAAKLASYTKCNVGTQQSCCATCDFESDPMSGEAVLESDANGTELPVLVDFAHGLAATIVGSASGFLSGRHEETLPNGSLRSDLGINVLVRQLLNGSGTLHVEGIGKEIIDDSSDPVAKARLTVKEVTLTGLDGFTQFDVLQGLSKWTLANSVALRSFGVELGLGLEISPPSGGDAPEGGPSFSGDGVTLVQDFSINASAEGLRLAGGLLLAFVLPRVQDLQLGPLLADPFDCVLNTTYMVNLTSLNLSIAALNEPQVGGLLSEASGGFVSGLVHGLFLSYETPMLVALPNFVETDVRALANAAILERLSNVSGECPPPEPFSDPPRLVDFQTAEQFAVLKSLLDRAATPEAANKAIDRNFPGGTARILEVAHFEQSVQDTSDARTVTLRLSNARLTGLDQVDELELLEPMSAYVLHSSAGLGFVTDELGPATVTSRRLGHSDAANSSVVRFEIDLLLGVDDVHGGSLMLNNVTFGVGINHVRFLLEVMAKLDWARIARLRLGSVFVPDCYLALLAHDLPGGSLRITDTSLRFEEIGVSLECHDCSSDSLRDYALRLAHGGAAEEVTPAVNRVVGKLADALKTGAFTQVLDYLVATSTDACAAGGRPWNLPPIMPPAPPVPPEKGTSDILPALVTIILLALAAVALPFLLCGCNRSDSPQDAGEVKGDALSGSDVVPRWLAVVVPVLLACCVAVFVTAHLAISLSVDIRFTVLTLSFEIEAESTSLMRGLALLVDQGQFAIACIFYFLSVFWAYLRVFAMIALWYTPSRLLPRRLRGKLFRWLGKLSKWCMIDLYAVGMVAVAINVRFGSPRLELLPDGLYDVELAALPQIGVLLYIVAQFVSQLVSHVQLHYHRMDVGKYGATDERGKVFRSVPASLLNIPDVDIGADEADEEEVEAEVVKQGSAVMRSPTRRCSSQRSVLCMHRFRDGGWRRGGSRSVPVVVRVLTPLTILFGCGLLLGGLLFTTYQVDAGGLTAMLMDFASPTGYGRRLEYSASTLVANLVRQATGHVRTESMLATLLIAAVYAISTFVAPMAVMLASLVLWVAPLTRRAQERLLLLCEALSEWQYLEVYLVAVLLTVEQLEELVNGLAEDNCVEIDALLRYLMRLDLISPDEAAECIVLVATPQAGFYFLIGGAVILNIFCRFVRKLATRLVEEGEDDDGAEDSQSTDEASTRSDSEVPSSDEESAEGLGGLVGGIVCQ